ncbi:MAG: dihydrolipoamide acetyltransferase family protein, partial [Solirubrobacteraceae bacterium]
VGAATSPAMAWPESSAAEASDFSVRTPTRVQQVIARRMVQAHASVPDFQVQTEVVMDGALRLREQLKEAGTVEIVPSINDIIVKACAIALRSHPTVNSSYREDGFHVHSRVNIGVAVAAEQALLVPTIFDADVRSLGSLARETRRLAERARAGTLAPGELSGATFTVSNLGMFGMTAIKPIVNTPQAAILGVGALRLVLVRDAEGELADRSVLTLTLSCDHRIIYGAEAARFLADVKALLEAPINVLL